MVRVKTEGRYKGLHYFQLVELFDWSSEEHVRGLQQAISHGEADAYCGLTPLDVRINCPTFQFHSLKLLRMAGHLKCVRLFDYPYFQWKYK